MKRSAWIGTAVALVAVGGGLTYVAGWFARQELRHTAQESAKPHVTVSRPPKDATEVSPMTAVIADIKLGGGAGVDEATLAAGLKLVRTRDGVEIPTLTNSSGGGDDLVLKPAQPLDLGTQYTFKVTPGVKTTDGTPFDPYEATFITAKQFQVGQFPAAFEKVPLASMKLDRDAFTTLQFGPDGLLYAGTFAGMIHRFKVLPDGTTQEIAPVPTVLRAGKGPRLITGICFDPKSTADAPVLWVNHGQFAINPQSHRPEGADDWTSKLSRLTGKNLDQYEDVLVGLPRAYKDHLNFQIAFGPDGALYFAQGSNTSVGDLDKKWGYRPERKLTAAVLRLDVAKLGKLPLDVKTEEGGTYDPAAPDAPLTLYATGVRSAFHLLLHRNGHLYTGVNGAAGNEGNTPASPDGRVPAVRDIKQTTDDLFLKIEPGAYYGHPNPARGQYVLNGGNPTAGPDVQEIAAYPVGTLPAKNWHSPTYVFGKNYSPNGLIDYKPVGGVAGVLDGCVLVTRYSDGKDILVLKLDDRGDVVETIAGLDGFTGLNAPLDLIEDPKTGNLYVAEYGGQSVSLLRPKKDGRSDHAQITAVTPGR